MSSASLSDLDPVASAEATPEPKTWSLVTQVKSHRVVYFTDDPAYQPPMDGDWYYVSPFAGNSPANGLT